MDVERIRVLYRANCTNDDSECQRQPLYGREARYDIMEE